MPTRIRHLASVETLYNVDARALFRCFMNKLSAIQLNELRPTPSKIAVSVLLAITSINAGPLFAQSDAEEDNTDTIIVTATRTEKTLEDVPATVSVIDADQIEREISNNISDLVRYEPGVSVAGGGRFGLSGFAIRGISGDRVLTLVDSTPTADEFSFGPFLSSRRNFVDLDALKTVEIVRGPSSSSFGSNAIGGVVNFVTKDPYDYLASEETFAGSAKTTYSSIDDSFNTTVLGAVGNQTLSAMIVATQRDFSETETFFDDDSSGAGRRAQNPQDGDNTNLFAKVLYQASETQSLAFAAERYTGDVSTDVLTASNIVSRGVLTQSQQGVDERVRERLSVDYRLGSQTTIFDQLSVLAYLQQSDAQQLTLTERVSPRSGVQDRIRSSAYEQENVGLRLQFNKAFEVGDSQHLLTYGVDYDQSDSATRRDGSTVNRATGTLALEFSAFPTRDFPLSEYTSQGFFLQNDISLLDGRIAIIPAVRHDNFKLTPSADPVYLGGNPGSPLPEGYDESETSLKLGAIFDLSDSWSVFGQYAEGFRAPALDAVNVGFTNFAGGYTALPNPDLRPERGEGVEFGLRHNSEFLTFDVVAYRNDYTDFIESLASRGFNPVTRLLEFQARNLSEARIEGLEVKLMADLAGLSDSLNGLKVRASYAQADGENLEENTPINSIDPEELVFGLAYAADNDRWSVETIVTATARKDAVDIDASSLQQRGDSPVQPFETPGAAILDVIGYVNLSDNLRLNYGVFNVTDKQYYSWSEEFVQNPATSNFDRLTEAGRNYSVSIKYKF